MKTPRQAHVPEDPARYVLSLLAAGKIRPEEAEQLLEALAEDEAPPRPAAAETAPPDPDAFDGLRRKFRWLGYLPLLPGLPLLAASLFWLRNTFRAGQYLWFALAWIPLALGLLLTWTGFGSQRMTWLFVHIRPEADSGPRRLFFGFPLPLRLFGWALRVGGRWSPRLRRTSLDEILSALAKSDRQTPLLVRVDDEGAQVELYLG